MKQEKINQLLSIENARLLGRRRQEYFDIKNYIHSKRNDPGFENAKEVEI